MNDEWNKNKIKNYTCFITIIYILSLSRRMKDKKKKIVLYLILSIFSFYMQFEEMKHSIYMDEDTTSNFTNLYHLNENIKINDVKQICRSIINL